ncbi:hypothetical protein JKP88DRAFT_283041 [Tribonema minus]|uniref:Uncharacterized protein n=1 Tax=Tribonema minus TaxID=303371 RepID=A0A835YKC5_9STRA|nr:hypothetical protein JKP88DRAFT_283041 [Tribonema minus]
MQLVLLLLLLQQYLIVAAAVDVPHQQQQYHRHAGAAGGVVRECERVESEKLEYCCAEAYNDLLSQAEQQLLDNDVSVSGDAVYARAIGRCKRWKQDIVDSRTCAPVFERIRHGASTCSRSPFNDDYAAIKRGHLATQEPNEWVRKRCDKQRFLIWTRNSGDFYAGHKHKRTSMMCQFREAYALNRTLVLDSFVGMSM